ncbi:hypothetical protein DP806_16535 [Salmonella enterica subsp. enterica serovar Saintpaul]|nr:hypothetical protein [Salmonella enterica subsp. enterica serovar Saintpaul]
MKTITATSSFSELSRFASSLNLSLITANIGYELWKGDSYKGGFTTLSAVAEALLVFHELAESAAEEAWNAQRKAQQAQVEKYQADFGDAESMLAEAVSAAVMVHDHVVGYCRVLPGTKRIQVASQRTADGAPVTVQTRRVSFSSKNLLQACELPTFTPFISQGELYYVSYPNE